MAEQYDQFLEVGLKMKLEGKELVEFIDKKVKEIEERQDRMFQRELEKERIQIEKQKLELELEVARMKVKEDKPIPKGEFTNMNRLPKIPIFNPNIDALDAYITRFESIASQAGWSDEQKFSAFSNLLAGDTLQILYNLPPEKKNYEDLKKALFVRYKYTEEGFREKFRDFKPQDNIDFATFVNTLQNYRDKYFHAAKVTEGNFQQLADLILKEQIYRVCNKDLVAFLKERNPTSISHMITLAEQYIDAHPTMRLGKSETDWTAATNRAPDLKDRSRPRYRENNETYQDKSRFGSSNQQRNHYQGANDGY